MVDQELLRQYEAGIVELLTTLDNNRRRQLATMIIKSLSQMQALSIFFELMCSSQDAGVRQLAAVLLRKRAATLWRELDIPQQQHLKASLLGRLSAEPIRIVRLALVHLLGKLAPIALDSDWPELPQFIVSSMGATEVGQREIAMLVVARLVENVAEKLMARLELLTRALLAGLQDSEECVRLAALTAAGEFVSKLEKGSATTDFLDSIIPAMLDAMGRLLQGASSVDVVVKAMESLESVLDIDVGSRTKKSQFVLDVYRFVATVAGTKGHNAIRQRAAILMGSILQMKPKLVVKSGLVNDSIQLALNLLSEDDTIFSATEADQDDDDDDDFDGAAMTPAFYGGELMFTISAVIATKHYANTLIDMTFASCMPGAQSTPFQRKGLILALAFASRACAEQLRPRIGDLLAMTRHLTRGDEAPFVRVASLTALSHFCENLAPEILEHTNVIIPMVAPLLTNETTTMSTKICACVVIEHLCDGLGPDLDPFVAELVSNLVQLLPLCPLPKQSCVVRALASIAAADCPAFVAFAPKLLESLHGPCSNKDEDYTTLRASSIELVSEIQGAMGPAFEPYHMVFFECIMDGLRNSDDREVKRQCVDYLIGLCELMDKDFVQVLPTVMDLVIDLSEQHIQFTKRGTTLDAGDMNICAEDGDDAEEDAMAAFSGLGLMYHQDEIDLISSCLHALGAFARHVGSQFRPWLQRSQTVVARDVSHFGANVRTHAISAIPWLLFAEFDNREALSSAPIPDAVLDHVVNCMQVVFTRIEEDQDKDVVAAACDSLGLLMKYFGKNNMRRYFHDAVEAVLVLLRQEANCQIGSEDEDELDEDHDEVVTDAAFSLVDSLAIAFGEDLGTPVSDFDNQSALDVLVPVMGRYLQDDRPAADHNAALGTLGNLALHVGRGVRSIVGKIQDEIIKHMGNEDPMLRSNAAFCVRGIVEGLPDIVTEQSAPQFVNLLTQELRREPRNIRAFENSLSALCSVFRTQRSSFDAATLYTAILEALPLAKAVEETDNLIQTIQFLLEVETQVAVQSMGRLLERLGIVLTQKKVHSEVRDKSRHLVRTLWQRDAQACEQSTAGVAESIRVALRRAATM